MGLLLLGNTDTLAKDKETRKTDQAAADDLFTNGELHRLVIDLPRESVRSLDRDPRAYARATFREGKLVWTNAAVRLKGGAGSFRPLDDKPGLTIKLEDGSQRFHGLEKFHLNNSVQDPTYLSEWMCSELFRQAGVPAGRVAHAVVELNGRRLGNYVLLESINHDLLAQYFHNSHGNVYSLRANADVTQGLERIGGREPENGPNLEPLADASQEMDAERLGARLPQVLDLNRFLSFMAMEVLLNHWDGYTFNVKNYAVYHDLDADRFVFLPHDLDQVLRNANAPIIPRPQGIVSRAILRNPETRAAYRQRFGEVFTNVFVAPAITQRIDERVAKVAPTLREYDADLAREFVRNAASLKHRVNARAQNLATQLGVPRSDTLAFVNDVTVVHGWRVANQQENAEQKVISDAAGKSALWIAARGPSTASWRAKVNLEPGHYRLEGLVRTAGVKPVPNDPKGEGAGLRISRVNRSVLSRLVGDSPWQRLTFEFDVPPDTNETDLICELRAQSGEAWFDEQSLRLCRRR